MVDRFFFKKENISVEFKKHFGFYIPKREPVSRVDGIDHNQTNVAGGIAEPYFIFDLVVKYDG